MSFRAITGHRPIRDLLARAVGRATLPPSLLFTGPEGVGKRLTAIALAQALNCEHPVTTTAPDGTIERDACGACAACSRIERGMHADVLIITPGDTAGSNGRTDGSLASTGLQLGGFAAAAAVLMLAGWRLTAVARNRRTTSGGHR